MSKESLKKQTKRSQHTLTGELRLKIYYEDTDFTGFVYHANYLKYFDRAREELLGIEPLKRLYETDRHFVVKEASLDYRKPAFHGDEVIVKSRVCFEHPVLVHCHHEVVRSDGTLLVTGLVVLATVHKSGHLVRVPESFWQGRI